MESWFDRISILIRDENRLPKHNRGSCQPIHGQYEGQQVQDHSLHVTNLRKGLVTSIHWYEFSPLGFDSRVCAQRLSAGVPGKVKT